MMVASLGAMLLPLNAHASSVGAGFGYALGVGFFAFIMGIAAATRNVTNEWRRTIKGVSVNCFERITLRLRVSKQLMLTPFFFLNLSGERIGADARAFISYGLHQHEE